MNFRYSKKGILGNYFLNPFILNALSFLIALVSFELKWSESYQEIDNLLFVFLLFFIFVNVVLGVTFSKLTLVKFIYVDTRLCFQLLVVFVVALIADYLYSGHIAIVNLLSSDGVFYKEINHLPFGIYVAILGLGATLQIQYYAKYVIEKNRKYLLLSSVCLLLLTTTGTRSILVLCIVSCLLIQLSFINSKSITNILKLMFFFAISIFLFSEIGNIRSNNYKNETYMKINNIDVESILLSKGNATTDFKESKLPKSLFWIYTYTASPVANLNSILQHRKSHDSLDVFFMSNFLPDFVVKLTGYKKPKDKSSFVLDVFNAYTIFGLPAANWGYLGMFVTLCIITIFLTLMLLICTMIRNNIVILSIVACISSFSMFANMYQSDIFMFVIFFSLIISFVSRNRLPDSSQLPQCFKKKATDI
jgi:oligosaccharide repeat unit polymerase